MHREIEAYLHQTRELSEDSRKQVLQCLLMNECQFDLQTVKEYAQEVTYLDDNAKHFSTYLKASRERVEKEYQQKYLGMIDQVRVKALENVLDPGFQKMCGLKGSKLSGGQK